MNEFEIIEHYFRRYATAREDVLLGIGDDAALLRVPAGARVVGVQATLGAGAERTPEILAGDLTGLALARLACTATVPRWATLALTVPQEDPRWLAVFADGLARALAAHGIALVGGDTTRGPTTATLGLHGHLEAGVEPAPRRARAGDALILADAADPQTTAALRRLATRFAAVACEGDTERAARMLPCEAELRPAWRLAPRDMPVAGAVLVAAPAEQASEVAGARRLGNLLSAQP